MKTLLSFFWFGVFKCLLWSEKLNLLEFIDKEIDIKPLFTEHEIRVRTQEIAEKITDDYKDKDILALGVLKGACIFFSDLMRMIDLPMAVDFIIASSYIKSESSGDVQTHYDVRETIEGKDVLIVEDIVDTGFTVKYLVDMIAKKSPRSLKVCALLDKKDRRRVEVPLDYVGFEIPNLFVVGYGMDYENKFRNLPFIKIIDKKDRIID
jgi:hypoxanthine phosphoribosyltransferase